jgi:hypothetical protein
MAALSLRPRFVWGPRDASVLPAILAMHEAGAFAWVDGGRHRTSTTHVLNLAHAVALALHEGAGGRAYFVLDAGTRTYREFLTPLAATAGARLGDRSVPSWLVRPTAALLEGTWRLLGLRGKPPMTRFAIDMMSCTVTLRDERARHELGYRPIVSVDEGLAALAAG